MSNFASAPNTSSPWLKSTFLKLLKPSANDSKEENKLRMGKLAPIAEPFGAHQCFTGIETFDKKSDMRLIEKILGVAGIMLLGMSLGVGITAAKKSRAKRGDGAGKKLVKSGKML